MMFYVESIVYDTNIFDSEVFSQFSNLILDIENCRDIVNRKVLRREKMGIFINHLIKVEENSLSSDSLKQLKCMEVIRKSVISEFDNALVKV